MHAPTQLRMFDYICTLVGCAWVLQYIRCRCQLQHFKSIFTLPLHTTWLQAQGVTSSLIFLPWKKWRSLSSHSSKTLWSPFGWKWTKFGWFQQKMQFCKKDEENGSKKCQKSFKKVDWLETSFLRRKSVSWDKYMCKSFLRMKTIPERQV